MGCTVLLLQTLFFFFLKECVTPYMHNNTCNVARGMDLVITKSQYHTGEQSSRLRDFL